MHTVTEIQEPPDWRRDRRPSVLKPVLWVAGVVVFAFAVAFLFMVVIPGR